MAKLQIAYANFPTSYASYSNRFYATNQYYYIRAESWGMRASVNSAFLNDWHGSCRVARWTSSGWQTVYDDYMQDTNARKSVAVKINADSLSISGSYNHSTNTETHNLWRVYFDHDQWGGNYGVDVVIYIGSCGTMSQSLYNSLLYHEYIYSNGTVGKSQCGLLSNGSSSASDNDVLSYFASNSTTKIYNDYSRHCVGALRT